MWVRRRDYVMGHVPVNFTRSLARDLIELLQSKGTVFHENLDVPKKEHEVETLKLSSEYVTMIGKPPKDEPGIQSTDELEKQCSRLLETAQLLQTSIGDVVLVNSVVKLAELTHQAGQLTQELGLNAVLPDAVDEVPSDIGNVFSLTEPKRMSCKPRQNKRD